MTALTRGHLLDGRVRYAQPANGFRSGIEPVLLAAAIPARPGEAVLEAGSGAGAGLLCLAHRVPGITGLGIERDSGLASIAQGNAAANDFSGLTFRAADLLEPHWLAEDWPGIATAVGSASALAGRDRVVDHAFANPPYHAPDGTASPDAARQGAKRGAPGLLAAWCQAMARTLRRGGTLTLIIPAAVCSTAAEAFRAADCGGLTLYPLWPHAGAPAKLILLQAAKDSRTPDRVEAGLVLHAGTTFTQDAQAILRHGAALPLRSGRHTTDLAAGPT